MCLFTCNCAHSYWSLVFCVCVSLCVAGKGASELESGSRGREGVGFRASSAVHSLTNYLWNCCIHSHLNRNLSKRGRRPASPQRRAEQPIHCRITSSTTALPPPCPPHTPPCFSTVSPSLPLCLSWSASSLPLLLPHTAYDDGLSLMQIYNHFICRCLPPRPAAGT